MSNNNTNTKVMVPMYKKIAFGVGMLANQMFPAALGVFMVVLLAGFGFDPWMVGFLTFAPRLFDFIIDPIMGFITDNTRSRWGRRRHYVFIGALIMGISFLLMWQIFKENGVNFNFFYFLTFKLCLYLGLTIFSVPFVAMGYEMSEDFHERTQIMAIAQWIGQWAWVIVPWFWIIMYDKELFSNPEVATRTLAIWVGIPCMIFAMVPAFFITSKSTVNETSYKSINIRNIGEIFKNLIHEFKEAFKIADFRKLCFATFYTFNAFNTVAQFTFFIIVYYLFNGNQQAAGIWPAIFGSGGALVTTFLVIPLVVQMAKKIGKKKAFLVSQSISIFGYILLYFLFIPGKPYLFLIAIPFFSFGIGGLFTTMMSMTADVCDVDELNYGQRREGIFGAIYWWVVKFGFAVAGLLSYLILDVINFDGNLTTQTPETLFWLRFCFSAIPIAGTLTAIYYMWNYGLTEEKLKEIQIELAVRKGKTKVQSSAYLSGKLVSLLKNGSIDTSIDKELNQKSNAEIESMYSEILDDRLHGLCFSPYNENQKAGDILSAEQIKRRLDIISPFTSWIRSFSCTEGNELIPEIAHQKGLKTVVGAWISNDKTRNEKEIDALIKLAKLGLVDIAVVGNEVLHRNEISEQELIAYIKRVKEALPNIPVGYVDAYYQFLDKPNLISSCDLLLVNCYPFWEGANIDYAASYLKNMMELTKNVAQGKKIIISETGWPSKGEAVDAAIPSEINAIKYFVSSQKWAKNNDVDLFYFSSFDESWKVIQEGTVGTSWGIWDKNEKLKIKQKSYVI
ncbi:MFS transporter [Flavobacterium sp. 25HG05S-40]|uniref:MFS transporter n=1 Tax=Flavobacterium sp. 25HG05S-40 TaxID=3458682 RepID=UPI004044DD31